MTAATVLGILLAHLVGDYLLQSDWMAAEKAKRWWPAWAHALTYGLPHLAVTRSIPALAVIVVTHAVIDHYRLARHVCWAKNQLAPTGYRSPWAECTATGYPAGKPVWLATWLMIIADNTIHLAINAATVYWLARRAGISPPRPPLRTPRPLAGAGASGVVRGALSSDRVAARSHVNSLCIVT
jgi:hypothetical protein